MKRYLVGLLVFLGMTFATNRQNLLYRFLRSLIGLILTLGLKTVYLFRSTLDSIGNIRTRVSTKRHDREYVMSSIGELRETTQQLIASVNSLSHDMVALGKMQTDLMIELRRIRRDSCQGQCDTCSCDTTNASNVDVTKYNALIETLRASTDTLAQKVSALEKDQD